MFQHAYQSGSHLEIFDAKGLKQTEKINDKLFKISHSNMMAKTYDKYLKNYIYEVLPGTKATIQFPKDDRQELGLLQHYLVLQIFLGMDSTFSLELVISDTNTNKRRLIFTNSVKEIERNHFHIKIPLDNIKRGVWLNLSFDLLSYFELFPSNTFRALESFIISGNFKLRKIFTMKDPLIESSSSEESPALPYLFSNGSQLQKPQGVLSKAVNYGPGVTYENQLIYLKSPLPQQREYQTPIKPPRDSKQSTQNLSGSFNINTPTLLSFMGRAGKHRAEDSLDMSSKLKSNNTSRFVDASKSPRRHKSKENSAIYLNDPAKNSLASTADSQKCMSLIKLTSPTNNIKPRNFFSPRHEFQFPPAPIKEDVSMRLSTDEPRVAPRSMLLDQKQKSAIRIVQKSNDKTKHQTITPGETPKKSKSTVRINKLHEIIELNEKASLYNRRMNQKKPMASYLLPNLSSPKLGMIASDLQTTTAAIRSPNMNNPWTNLQGELSFPFTRNSTTKFSNGSGFKTPRGASENPMPVKIELKPVRAKETFHNKSGSKGSVGGLSRKETITTAATTPKDMMMCDSDRFSILSRSGDEYGIRSRNREILMSREEANYKDEIESIEENLEYENHSNTSGICASHILNNEEEEGLDFIRGDKSTSPDLYKPFLKKENEEEGSMESVIYHGGRKGRQLSKLDTGKTKRIAKQFEDKVMDIVSNNRPYSPPFQRKIEVQKPSWFVKRESLSNLQKAALILKTEEALPVEKEDVFERALQTDRYCAN